MPKAFTNIDLNQNELQHPVIHPSSTAPLNPREGQIYYNTTDKNIYRYDGIAWVTYQSQITVSGVLQGNGSGDITEANLSTVAFTGDAEDLIWPEPLILYCGTATEVVS